MRGRLWIPCLILHNVLHTSACLVLILWRRWPTWSPNSFSQSWQAITCINQFSGDWNEMHESFLLEYGYLFISCTKAEIHSDQESRARLWTLKLAFSGITIKIDYPPKSICRKSKDLYFRQNYLTSSLLDKFILFYHLALAHASMTMAKPTNHSW